MKNMQRPEKINVVTEYFKGGSISTELPKEEAERLFRKIRASGARADMRAKDAH